MQDLVTSAEAVEVRAGAEVRRIDGDRVGASHAPPFSQRRHLLAEGVEEGQLDEAIDRVCLS